MVRNQDNAAEENEKEYANLLRQERFKDKAQQLYAPKFDPFLIQQNNRIDISGKEASARLHGGKRASNTTQFGYKKEQNLADDNFDINKSRKRGKGNKNGREREWARSIKAVKRVARVSELGLGLSGGGDLADVFGDIGDIAEAVEGGTDLSGPGGARRLGSNLAGRKAGNIAQKRGLSGGKSAALGGALSGALQGEGVGGIAKGALSWYFLYIAFGALFTLIGSIPALLYLDFHYIMSKFGSKIFGEMFLWQKLVLLVANIVAFFVITLILAVIIVTSDPCLLADSIGTWWSGLFGVVCGVF